MCFYQRTFRGKTFQILCWTTIAIVISWGLAFFFATLLQCDPVALEWETLEPVSPSCYNFLPMFYATAISNPIIDTVDLILPIPFIWKLHLTTQKKLEVVGLFMLGGL